MDLQPPIYGLDIEVDTTVDAFDPSVAAIVAVAVSADDGDAVLTAAELGEAEMLGLLDAHLRRLPPGVIATWNGSMYDLPFLHDRAAHHGVPLGLVLRDDTRLAGRGGSLPGHLGPVAASWWQHSHLDAYRLWRHVRTALGVSASLKNVARHLGLDPVEADASRVHELDDATLRRYVTSDARVTRILAAKSWDRAAIAIDDPDLIAGVAGSSPLTAQRLR